MAATFSQSPDGQSHDRFRVAPPDASSEILPYTPPSLSSGEPTAHKASEITVVQRMLSATAGSLLTGLLVTPLDVVRIRWQSQTVSYPVIDFEKLPANFRKIVSSSSALRPSDIGVTACCREVFFMNANTEMCLADAGKAESVAAVEAVSAVRASLTECAVEQHQQKTFHSTIDGLRKIARNEGLFTLWRGLSPTLVMSIPANVIYFTGYEWLRLNPHSPVVRVSSEQYAPLVAGSSARVLAATAVGPIELFRTRLQASHGASAAGSLMDTFQDLRGMVAAHGLRSLWRGLTLTLWRDVPFSGMYWWGYEAVRGQISQAREQRRQREHILDLDGERRRRAQHPLDHDADKTHRDTFLDSFTAGALAGAVASVATMPFDVGKTRTQVFRDVQMRGVDPKAVSAATLRVPEEQSMTRLLWHIFRTEGAAGLFKGWIPRTLKVAPACAIMISSYEVGKKLFHGVNERTLHRQLDNARTD